MVHYAEPGKKPKWGYFLSEGHPEVITKFEGTKATLEFLQAIAYEVYVKNVTFGPKCSRYLAVSILQAFSFLRKSFLSLIVLPSLSDRKSTRLNSSHT